MESFFQVGKILIIYFFVKQFIHFQKRDTKNTENKSLHTFNKKKLII